MTVEWQPPTLGLYVHLPWCVRKCPYCDFNSHELRGELPAGRYVHAVLDDLQQDLHRVGDRVVGSVYFGGGTPSLFPARHIESLLAGIRQRVPLAADAEITLEANPGTVERDRFRAYREAGVTRVSLGVQSFDDELLRGIGRIHGAEEAARALDSLGEAGLDSFNVDLMFGLPGQDTGQAAADIATAVAAGPAHISHYQLTLEPNTAFAASPPVLPPEEECWAMQETAAELLTAGGYTQYEISAWAVAGGQGRHNLNYWKFGDYLGVGAGAHAKLTDVQAGEIRRLVKVRHPKQYLAGDRVALDGVVGGADLVFEYFLNALRLRAGFRPGHFEMRTGLSWDLAAPRVENALRAGLLEAVDGGFRPSGLGWRFGNDLQALFLP